MLSSVMLRALPVLFVLLAVPNTARAVAFLSIPGTGGIAQVDVVVAQDGRRSTVTTRLQIDATAPTATAFFSLPKGTDPESVKLMANDAVFEALRRQTEPRFTTMHAPDPCDRSALETPDKRRAWPEDAPSLSSKYAIEYIPFNKTKAALREYPKLPKTAVDELLRSAGGLVKLSLTDVKRKRGGWTRPVQWTIDGDPTIVPGLGALNTAPGREHRLTVFTLSSKIALDPKIAIDRLPSTAVLPEIAIETPRDTNRAIVRHFMRKKGDRSWIRTFGAPLSEPPNGVGSPASDVVLSRFEVIITPKDQRTVGFVTAALAKSLIPDWIIRRVWRAPIGCAAPKFVNNVRIQQMSELRAYAGMTGRTVKEVLQRSRARGYAQREDGTLKPVKESTPPGAVLD